MGCDNPCIMETSHNGKSAVPNQPSLKPFQVLKVSREVEWAPVRDGKGRHAPETARCGKRGGEGLLFFYPIGWGWLRTTTTTTTTTTTITTNIGPGNIGLKSLNMLSQFGHFFDRLTMHRLHCALATSVGVTRFWTWELFFKAQPPKRND